MVVESCGHNHTYLINGPDADFLGDGDLHDVQYDAFAIRGLLESDHGQKRQEYCRHILTIYPSSGFESEYKTNNPQFYSLFVVCLFGFAIVVFILYDIMVTWRQKKTQTKANRTDEIVDQLFPSHVRDKLFNNSDHDLSNNKKVSQGAHGVQHHRVDSQHFMAVGIQSNDRGAKPIAELFPEATVSQSKHLTHSHRHR